MKCPKCSFDQPEDRFCANCGVDVTLYTPQKHVIRSFTHSILFYILIATLILSGVFWYLGLESPPNTDVIGIDRPTSVFRRSGQEARSENETTDVAADEIETPTAQTQAAEKLPTTSVPPTPSAPKLNPKATTFRVSIFEVDLEYASTFLGVPMDGRMAIGTIREDLNGQSFAERRRQGNQGGQVSLLHSGVQTISTENQPPNSFSFVSFDPRLNSDIGLMLQLKASSMDDKKTQVLIEGRRIIGRGDSPQPDVLNFQQEVSIPLKSPAYIVGIVQGRNPVDDSEAATLAANTAFSIFKSPKFRANQSLLILTIEAIERP